jgi:hypothetical protein
VTFYTYLLRDPRNFEPIYVGKGRGRRMYVHWNLMLSGNKGRNPKLYSKLTSIFRAGYLAPIYEKWLDKATEALAFWMERFLIKSIGRKDLCNLSDGGEGPSGSIKSKEACDKMRALMRGNQHSRGFIHSTETRQKMSAAKFRQPPFSATTRQKLSVARTGKPLSAEHCLKLSESHLGKTLPAEQRKKIGDSQRGRVNTEATIQRMRDGRKAAWITQRLTFKKTTRTPETCQRLRDAWVIRKARKEQAVCKSV